MCGCVGWGVCARRWGDGGLEDVRGYVLRESASHAFSVTRKIRDYIESEGYGRFNDKDDITWLRFTNVNRRR